MSGWRRQEISASGHRRSEEEVMGQVLEVPLSPRGSFGALVRACRHQAFLSQEQLAARAGLSERTVRNLEAGQVRSPRADTVVLLADALRLGDPERAGWFAAARGPDQRGAGAADQDGRDDEPAGWVAEDSGPVDPAIQARAGRPDAGSGDPGGLSRADRGELAELRRENRRLREDVEILKRAAVIFARVTR